MDDIRWCEDRDATVLRTVWKSVVPEGTCDEGVVLVAAGTIDGSGRSEELRPGMECFVVRWKRWMKGIEGTRELERM